MRISKTSSTNKRAFAISEKVDAIVKSNRNSLKNTCEYAYY